MSADAPAPNDAQNDSGADLPTSNIAADGVEDKDDEPGSSRTEPDKTTAKPSFFQRLRHMIPFRKNGSIRQDLEVVLEQGDADITFSPEERAMLSNILALREVRADDIMVPRADVDGVDSTITLGQLMFIFEDSRHSRLPVYRETLDDPIGMVHVKDVMGILLAQSEKNPTSQSKGSEETLRNDVSDYDLGGADLSQTLEELEILRPILFLPPSMPASEIFAKMQTERTQMALVIDEYGGTDGLLSMEDVVEAIVGDIEDEHDGDEDGPTITKESENRWIADARVPLESLSETLGISIDLDDNDNEDIDTLGGLLFTQLGRVPVRGEVVRAFEHFDFEIAEADPRRIRRVRIVRAKAPLKRRRRTTANANDNDQANEKIGS